MYPAGQQYVSCEYKEGELHGPFMVFYEDGSMKRRGYYKFGRVTKSQCYDSEGDIHRCEPFYQPTKFTGKSSELDNYLKQKLGTVLDGERIRIITATLTINEIGQITNVNVSVKTDQTSGQQVPAVTSYVQQTSGTCPNGRPIN